MDLSHLSDRLQRAADNSTEFHQFQETKDTTGMPFYFCTRQHSWERGTNENTNGLIREYFPKGESMANVTQRDCDRVAKKLNTRPSESARS